MTILTNDEKSEGASKPTQLIYAARQNAATHGNELAWVDGVAGEQITHEVLFERTLIAIEQLKSRKLAPGQIVCLVLTRTGDFLPLLMACIELGLILAPIGEDRHDIKSAVRFLRPRLVLYASEFPLDSEIVSSKSELSSLAAFMEAGVKTNDTGIAAPARRHDLREAPALLIRTSGTTGQAKYVELNERGLAWNSFSLQARFQVTRTDRILCTLPWSQGMASGIISTMQQVGGAFGVAVAGMLFVNILGSGVYGGVQHSERYAKAFAGAMSYNCFAAIVAALVIFWVHRVRSLNGARQSGIAA